MNEAMLEQDLRDFDYSTIHPVREKILGQLLEMQRKRKANNGGVSILRSKMAKRLDFGSLEYAAAAGNATVRPRFDEATEDDEEN